MTGQKKAITTHRVLDYATPRPADPPLPPLLREERAPAGPRLWRLAICAVLAAGVGTALFFWLGRGYEVVGMAVVIVAALLALCGMIGGVLSLGRAKGRRLVVASLAVNAAIFSYPCVLRSFSDAFAEVLSAWGR